MIARRQLLLAPALQVLVRSKERLGNLRFEAGLGVDSGDDDRAHELDLIDGDDLTAETANWAASPARS